MIKIHNYCEKEHTDGCHRRFADKVKYLEGEELPFGWVARERGGAVRAGVWIAVCTESKGRARVRNTEKDIWKLLQRPSFLAADWILEAKEERMVEHKLRTGNTWSSKCLQEILMEIWRLWKGEAEDGDVRTIHMVLTVESPYNPKWEKEVNFEKALAFAIVLNKVFLVVLTSVKKHFSFRVAYLSFH